jgi:hypothetical protein
VHLLVEGQKVLLGAAAVAQNETAGVKR